MSIESFTPLAATSPISEYIALADQHAFVYTWLVLKPGYIEVFINDIKKALHIDYTVTGIGEPLGGVVNINLSINILDGDKISIKRSEQTINFVEIEKNYFFKSLQEKFAFR